jgi:hypothetical protein
MPLPNPIIEVLTVCATIVYGPDLEKTDDVANRNATGSRTLHSRSCTAFHRQRQGDQLE